jgi:hypothetical protein
MHVYFWPREWDLSQSLLHLWTPFFHEIVDVWHLLGIINCRCWS